MELPSGLMLRRVMVLLFRMIKKVTLLRIGVSLSLMVISCPRKASELSLLLRKD